MDANATGEATRLELDVGREDPGQSRAITRQMSLEVDSSQVSILQPVSGNAAGRKAKGKAEARHGGKERPSSITALKLIAKQGVDEKAQLKDWKAELMAILASEIKQLQDAHGEAVEAQYQEMEKQREHFVAEIEALKEELKELKEGKAESERQAAGEMERSLVKASVPSDEEEVFFTQSQGSKSPTPTPANPSTGSNLGKRSYASVAVSKPAQVPEQPWTQVKYKSRKPSQQQSAKSALNAEYQGRRILFPREVSNQHMSEADLMLVLNEALQKAGEGIDTRFSRVRYSPSGAVSALLTEKANAGLLIPRLSNVLIRAAKTVDAAIVGVEVLEHWQRLKVHGMSLERYLGGGKMELLKREVESSTGIQLKTLSR